MRSSQRSISPFNPQISYYNALQNFKEQKKRNSNKQEAGGSRDSGGSPGRKEDSNNNHNGNPVNGTPNEHRKSKFVKKIPPDVLRMRAASQKRSEKQNEGGAHPQAAQNNPANVVQQMLALPKPNPDHEKDSFERNMSHGSRDGDGIPVQKPPPPS